jgi:cytochrome P450
MINDSFLIDPYPSYRRLHAAGPIHWSDEFCGGAWLLTSYEDVANALRDSRFSARRAGGWVNSSGREASAELGEFKSIFSRSMLFMNGRQHARVRRAAIGGFKPDAIVAMAPRIQRSVDHLIDTVAKQHNIDFIREFARRVPSMVIADMLSVDPSIHNEFMAWSDDIAEFMGSPTPSLDTARRAKASLVALNDYFRAMLPHRRRFPGSDLVSQLIRAEATGAIVTSKELLAQCCTLLFAGHETTRNLLGNGLYYLLKNTAHWQMLLANPALIRPALRELLRFDSPVQYTGRILTEDMLLHGKKLSKGDLVILLIGAANRDPAKFSDPDQLILTRNEANHLSFGHGPHVCMGATLTYMEAEIALASLLSRLPNLKLASGVANWGTNPVYRGLVELPLIN